MKHFRRFTWVLIVLGFVGAAVFFILGPDIVPVHYNSVGEVDRMGSKYEYIFFPVFAAVMGVLFLTVAKQTRARKREGYELTEKIFLISAFGETLLFNGLGGFFMWKAAVYPEGALHTLVAMDMMRIFSLIAGVLMIGLGNVMPKARMNGLFGVRTSWSMSSDEVWRKSQRFGGFTAVLAGAVLLANAMFLEGVANLLVFTAVTMISTVVSIAASYRYYKEEKSA